MKLKGKILDLLFRRIAPEHLLELIGDHGVSGEGYGNRVDSESLKKRYREWFLSVAEAELGGYSDDEKELLFTQVERFGEERPELSQAGTVPPFQLLVDYGDGVLCCRSNRILCRFSEILDWRETYLSLGQDLIVTAWLAARHPYWRSNRFTWPGVIPTDNQKLDRILSAGIAENHYHLYGSAAVFSLNWSRLMTYPDINEENAEWFDDNLQPHISRGMKDNQWPMRKRLLYAAYIRALLFRCLREETYACGDELRKFDAMDEGEKKYRLLAMTDALRYQYGMRFQQPDGSAPRCLDYAFTRELVAELNEHSRILAGERLLLFQCFSACFSMKFDMETQWFFYLYLLLKSNFREEVIQVNRQAGFKNFQNYEKRKYTLWSLPGSSAYWNEAYRTAINAPLHEQPINSLEMRVTPSQSAVKNLENIFEIDRATMFYDRAVRSYDEFRIPPLPLIDQHLDELDDMRSFFVLHFIKRKDAYLERRTKASTLVCRHEELRRENRQEALAIVEALRRHPYLRRRIRGIDACSNEIGCRPEIFAIPFRFLQTCPTWLYADKSATADLELMLSVTYHAGEDFLDIADGLRAIDEAICFLNMERGSRIGHALALGVDPGVHYSRKHSCIVLPKQDLLDNLVWLYFRSDELGVTIHPTLKAKIRDHAENLLTELYRRYLLGEENGENWEAKKSIAGITLRDYYKSWLLRGDDPSRYSPKGVIEGRLGDVFEPYSLNQWSEYRVKLRQCRGNAVAAALYYFYHYSSAIKDAGSRVERFWITPDYLRLMRQMQRGMQAYVDSLGLSVECNPSSNTLIGTFDFYDRHPIFRFNSPASYRQSDSEQLHVSLNTDDQGVFDISLTFEYALVAAALASKRDDNGGRLYADREVEEYIRNLQRMGNEQAFSEIRRDHSYNCFHEFE